MSSQCPRCQYDLLPITHTHNGEKQFVCGDCGYHAPTDDSAAQHEPTLELLIPEFAEILTENAKELAALAALADAE